MALSVRDTHGNSISIGNKYPQKMDQSRGRKTALSTDRRGYHEYAKALREPASGHQILCARYSRYSDLSSSPDSLTPTEPEMPSHTALCSCWFRQDHLTLSLGTIPACKQPSALLDFPRGGRQ